MKKIILCMALMVAGLQVSFAQEIKKADVNKNEKLSEALELNEEQSSKLAQFMKGMKEKKRGIVKSDLSNEVKKERMAELKKAENLHLKSILNDKQYMKYQEIDKQRQFRKGKKMKAGKKMKSKKATMKKE